MVITQRHEHSANNPSRPRAKAAIVPRSRTARERYARLMDDAATVELTSLRRSIDNIDAALIHLLAERFKSTQTVGQLKAATNMPPSDPERERVQIERLRALATEAQLDPAFAEKWFNFIVAEVIHHHEQIATTGAVVTAGAVAADSE